MIVFNLSCAQQHHFDGWFRSADDFTRQVAHDMVACPLCGDTQIAKQLSAPRLNMGATAAASENSEATTPSALPAVPAAQAVLAASMMPDLQAHMLSQFKQFVIANTENVGGAFAETARRIHYGEESPRNIRGKVSREESRALRDEGIETVVLPPGIVMDEGVQ